MLQLDCPHCGPRDEAEFSCGGEAHIARPLAENKISDREFADYLFLRDNPKGVHLERWRHANGCGKWFLAARCTSTLEVFGTYPAQTTRPPEDVLEAIRAKRPGWEMPA